MVKVKICGIKRLEDAHLSIKYGADALGFLVGQVHKSSDFLQKEVAKSIISQLPPYCSPVLVTHSINWKEILKLVRYLNVTTVQLPGAITPEDIEQIKKTLPWLKVIKSIHVKNENSINEGRKYLSYVDAVLPDTFNLKNDQIGGTGLTHDWNISRKMVTEYNKPLILAGGLNPNNIVEAIKFVKPYAIDANSGIKATDGFKDPEKLRLFIERAKAVNF